MTPYAPDVNNTVKKTFQQLALQKKDGSLLEISRDRYIP